MKRKAPIAELDMVLAVRHTGPFPAGAERHPRDKEVILCLDCMEDLFEA